tara:strand:+ start:1114 stop:2103 length:990 start_codon:yes stop_codon:yes gene_type:complete
MIWIKKLGEILFFLVSCFLVLLLTETMLKGYFRDSLDLDMEMWKYAVNLKEKGEEYPNYHVHKPDSQAFLMGNRVTINDMGLRDELDFSMKDKNEFSIFFVGDSFTFGWGVSNDETFSELIEKKLESKAASCGLKIRGYNLGVGNYNSIHELDLLTSISRFTAPDLVVLTHFINDAEPVIESDRPAWYQRTYLFGFVQSKLMRINQRKEFTNYYSDLYKSEGWSGNQRALLAMKSFAEKTTNFSLEVFLLPELRSMGPESELSEVYSLRSRFFSHNEYNFTDLSPYLSRFEPEALFVSLEDSHTNGFANRQIINIMAKKITPLLQERCL